MSSVINLYETLLQRQVDLNPGTIKEDWAGLEEYISFCEVSELCDHLAFRRRVLFEEIIAFGRHYNCKFIPYFLHTEVAPDQYGYYYDADLKVKRDSLINLMIAVNDPLTKQYNYVLLKQFTIEEIQDLCENDEAFSSCLASVKIAALNVVFDMHLSISKN